MKQEYFVVTRLHREDLQERGFDTKDVIDETMLSIARRMGDAYVENGFWQDIDIIAEHHNIPKTIK